MCGRGSIWREAGSGWGGGDGRGDGDASIIPAQSDARRRIRRLR